MVTVRRGGEASLFFSPFTTYPPNPRTRTRTRSLWRRYLGSRSEPRVESRGRGNSRFAEQRLQGGIAKLAATRGGIRGSRGGISQGVYSRAGTLTFKQCGIGTRPVRGQENPLFVSECEWGSKKAAWFSQHRHRD
ncbi:hypothetical protein KQX54_007987 [Cotesia glomerata]|uniref:Uncharacterized protein n=1 Tax=Cotesia glomerata TaxID=32391 RepID=A0AAV7HHZ9_COTGL|nr:hypothetical protein KQX54_007987 [Cotesia glomerata]